uniref:Uncharacterized protein n=1 Tax=Panagrolaimus davidi TaxID=227884 RepID=A0A914PVM3_9BILA
MIGVGITDLIGLTGWWIMAFMMIIIERFSFIFGKIAGAFAHTGWQGMVLFSVVLAVNRSDEIIGFLPFVQNTKERFWKLNLFYKSISAFR